MVKIDQWIFWKIFAQKEYFWPKTGQMKITIEWSIFELFLAPGFILSRKF